MVLLRSPDRSHVVHKGASQVQRLVVSPGADDRLEELCASLKKPEEP